MTTTRLSTRDYCMIALCASIIAIMAQITIPMPLGVPLTLQTFAVMLTATLLGTKCGTFAVFIYILLGGIGLPVFHGFSGGIQSLLGPTGGFLLTFPILAWFTAFGVQKYKQSKLLFIFCLITGTILNLTAGACMFYLVTHSNLMTALTVCVIPFIPTTILQVALAEIIGLNIRKRLTYIMN